MKYEESCYQVNFGSVMGLWGSVEEAAAAVKQGTCHLYVVVSEVKQEHLEYRKVVKSVFDHPYTIRESTGSIVEDRKQNSHAISVLMTATNQ